MCFLSTVNSGVTFCYCARNAALNSEIAGPGWHRPWMSLRRRRKPFQSETEEEKVKKRGREEVRKKRCLCLEMGGMGNRGLLWKNFLLFRRVHRSFYPRKIRTWLQQYKHDQVQFLSQSPDSKHSHIHSSTICLVFLHLLPLFPSDIPYLAYPKVSYQFPQWKQVPTMAVAMAAILEGFFLLFPAISCSYRHFLAQYECKWKVPAREK